MPERIACIASKFAQPTLTMARCFGMAAIELEA
jgi:hypothetical protein